LELSASVIQSVFSYTVLHYDKYKFTQEDSHAVILKGMAIERCSQLIPSGTVNAVRE